ncbi:MAG: ABC transporter ATP-binding protein [Treponemataceae bacterium]
MPSLSNVSESHRPPILSVHNLYTHFFSDAGTIKAVDGISFEVPKGKTLAIVGESGCGKSVTSLSIMGLIKESQGIIAEGSIHLHKEGSFIDLIKLSNEKLQTIRGKDIAMIFQEPMTSLNPVFTIGNQLDEALRIHNPSLSNAEIKAHTIDMLKKVGIPRQNEVYHDYPHQLSGGMQQRVMIAMALQCQPSLIIADEPTTALDVTIQAQILDLLEQIKTEFNTSIILITHDLGVVAQVADYVLVMYAGKIIESGNIYDIFKSPLHPYTKGLLACRPQQNQSTKRLYSIPGTVPNPINRQNICSFKDRCTQHIPACNGAVPTLTTADHAVACYLYTKEING